MKKYKHLYLFGIHRKFNSIYIWASITFRALYLYSNIFPFSDSQYTCKKYKLNMNIWLFSHVIKSKWVIPPQRLLFAYNNLIPYIIRPLGMNLSLPYRTITLFSPLSHMIRCDMRERENTRGCRCLSKYYSVLRLGRCTGATIFKWV